MFFQSVRSLDCIFISSYLPVDGYAYKIAQLYNHYTAKMKTSISCRIEHFLRNFQLFGKMFTLGSKFVGESAVGMVLF